MHRADNNGLRRLVKEISTRIFYASQGMLISHRLSLKPQIFTLRFHISARCHQRLRLPNRLWPQKKKRKKLDLMNFGEKNHVEETMVEEP